MIKLTIAILLTVFGFSLLNCNSPQLDFEQYPSAVISNDAVEMKIFLPDPENGLYRATRFDWSGVIGSTKYKGHEYFGYWKKTHDPMVHEDLTGPVEGFIEPGLGYAEAKPGKGFIRIGVGVIEKEDETEYQWNKTYKIIDHGKWQVDKGSDWIKFVHEIDSDFGYGYVYQKTIRLKNDGFSIEHSLQNKGEKTIETDQFNHNFFMIDGEQSGPAFNVSFPYTISTEHDLKGYVEITDKDLNFIRALNNDHVYMVLSKSGAGVTFTVDKPLHKMVFWACETTLSPENFIWISVAPGEQQTWISDYTLFVN